MAKHKNICNHVHLPVQSGSDRILKEMNRQHTVAQYITLVEKLKEILPDCSISQDLITGFPSETEADHQRHTGPNAAGKVCFWIHVQIL